MKLLDKIATWFATDEDDDTPVSRVYHPSERTCPPEVLRGLRAVDPAAELLYLTRGTWLLGVVRWNWERVESCAKTLGMIRHNVTRMEYGITPAEQTERARGNAERQALLQLGMQGFRPIVRYAWRDPDGSMVNDFRVRDWLYRCLAEQTAEAAMDWAEGIPQTARRVGTLLDAGRTRGWDAVRHAGRGKGFVTNPGLIGAV